MENQSTMCKLFYTSNIVCERLARNQIVFTYAMQLLFTGVQEQNIVATLVAVYRQGFKYIIYGIIGKLLNFNKIYTIVPF